MKLDATVLRNMDRTDIRVLEAIEMGQERYGHEIVTLVQINTLSNLRHGGSHKIVSSLLRDKLISHEHSNGNMDGYRLTNAGYDILALSTLKHAKIIAAFGQKIGTGKESDIYLAATPTGQQVVLKFHRLGRTSFRNVRKKRDYFNTTMNNSNRNEHKAIAPNKKMNHNNWLFLSKLSATKEYAFMKALYDVKYAVPQPIYYNRHVICMNLIRGIPLFQIQHTKKQISIDVAKDIYEQAMTFISSLAIKHGLIHCDFNEYNLLVDLSGIQAMVTDDTADPYVRHSGQSVAPDAPSIGALSKQPWEQSLLEQHDAVATGGGVEEPLPAPAAILASGEPKPIVTLIDFPQMISIQHVNAVDYYQRDVHCIQQFFSTKLSFAIPFETCPVTQAATWENVLQQCQLLHHSASSTGTERCNDTSTDTKDNSKNNHRIDATLRASGFSSTTTTKNNTNTDNDRMLELYYFTSGPRPVASAVTFREEDEHDNDDDDSEDDEEEEEEENDDDEEKDDDVHGDDDGNDDLISLADSRASCMSDASSQNIQYRLENLRVYSADAHVRREQITTQTKDRVTQQVEAQWRKSRNSSNNHNTTNTSTKKRNMNKSYIKGKRVHADVF